MPKQLPMLAKWIEDSTKASNVPAKIKSKQTLRQIARLLKGS